MAQLISATDASYRKRSWQDTSPPPNVLIMALGPGRTSLTLQFNLDIANQSYHRESMKGQTADIPNLAFLFTVPATDVLENKDLTAGQSTHKDSMKGQVVDPQNDALVLLASTNPGYSRVPVVNPVFNKHPAQDTTIQRNPVLDVLSTTLPIPSPMFEVEETYRHDSLSGQYGRNGPIIVIGPPPAFNEIYTFVSRLKTAQEPYVYPNTLVLGIAPIAPPPVYQQREDLQWRGKKTQETYQYPNALLLLAPVTSPFVRSQMEDLQWRGKKVQETYDFPNVILKDLPPIIIQPFVNQQFEHLQWRNKKTQEHYDFPNVIATFPPPIPPGFWVMAVSAGFYGGRFRTPGDIFLLASGLDFSDSSVDYQINSNGVGYGWMTRTAATMAYDWLESNGSPYLPPQDPNRRFIY